MGAEMVFKNKRVVTCGNAQYKDFNISFFPENKLEYFKTLQDLCSNEIVNSKLFRINQRNAALFWYFFNFNIFLLSSKFIPTGFSINDCAAHFTPTIGDKIIVNTDDVVKVDFRSHINGRIIDSAFTFSFNPKYDEFIDISKKATNYAISLSSPDVNLGDLGKMIEEYVKSKEVEIDNKVYPLYTLKDLTGHNIGPYIIHKSKALPNTAIQYPMRMEEGDIFAVEPFVSFFPK